MGAISLVKNLVQRANNRGVAVVYVAILLIALLAFAGLAIDLGYMYVTKSELQNTADAAALAGASDMRYIGPGGADPNDLVQANARSEAINFAARNRAATQNVIISNDNSNTLSDGNDITVGRWDSTTNVYTPNTTPVNAIQVRARRTAGSAGGPVSLFFARVLGRETMGASADAVAALPVRANSFISICDDSCTGMSTDPRNPTVVNRIYDRNPTTPGATSFAWTSLLNSISSVTQISPMVCNDSPNEQVCGQNIWTTQGQASSLFKDMEAVFNDPNFDRDNKSFDASGNRVVEWRVLVPVTQTCNPGNQPQPLLVTKYAFVWITSVCDTGGGNPCRPYSSNPCTNPGRLTVSRIACVDCANLSNVQGLRVVLVK